LPVALLPPARVNAVKAVWFVPRSRPRFFMLSRGVGSIPIIQTRAPRDAAVRGHRMRHHSVSRLWAVRVAPRQLLPAGANRLQTLSHVGQKFL